ncbi:MAG: hypothetical protein EA425_05005 [Puniceicoccaceae bacterium]|nr:MAG: hypothetical protein EA425_05005 [Puniceicoccaceae bacterium]
MRGRAWKGLGMGKQPIVPAGGWEVLADPEAVRHGVGLVFGARGGAAARLAETFHLRLLMARQLVQRVEAAVRLAKAPFLDLTPSAFRVGLGRLGTGLPGLWTAHVELAGWPAAVRLPGLSAEGGGGYRHPVKLSSSVYRLDASIQHRSAVGSVRLRSLDETGGGRHALEGTLAAGEALKAAPGNLLRVVLPVAGQPLPVVARVSPAEGLGPGEVRFRSVETTFAANQATALKELLGVSIDEVQADLLPEIGPACDLFSLGVIVAEFFLVSDGNTLAEAMDECRSLAAALAEAGVDAAGAAAAVRRMAGEDARWEKALGPARLLDGGETAGASRAIAGSLWWGLVAWIVRTIPGAGPASFRRGPGDAPPTRPAAVFEEPLKELDRLCALSAAAVFPEPAADAELRELVRRFRD